MTTNTTTGYVAPCAGCTQRNVPVLLAGPRKGLCVGCAKAEEANEAKQARDDERAALVLLAETMERAQRLIPHTTVDAKTALAIRAANRAVWFALTGKVSGDVG